MKENEANLSGEDIREGLTAIISVKIEEPQFEGQTKQKLGNSEARGAVDNILREQFTYFLEQNPSVAKTICDKSIMAQRARADVPFQRYPGHPSTSRQDFKCGEGQTGPYLLQCGDKSNDHSIRYRNSRGFRYLEASL